MDKRAIGVFDSGLGGITVLNKLRDCLPHEDYIYLADTKRAPYGEKSPEEILSFSQEIIEYFLDLDVKAIVIACNTASSYGYAYLKENYDLPIISVLEGGVDSVRDGDQNILVLATEATVKSSSYKKALEKLGVDKKVDQLACPLIVPMIEKGELDRDKEKKVLKTYLDQVDEKKLDTVILGCTHYPIWKRHFEELLDPRIKLIDPAIKTAQATREKLVAGELLTENDGPGFVKYLTTANDNQFKNNLFNIFKIESENIEQIIL